MNILFISEKDAANVSLARVAKVFINKGHEIKLFAPFMDRNVLECFGELFPIFEIRELREKDVEWCDMIFCSTLSCPFFPEFVFRAHKPIFTHNYLMNRQVNWGGDVCFAPSQRMVESDYDEYFEYSYIGIGEPKYDDESGSSNDNKTFLFIDSGHYPFSIRGKRELARTLLKICNDFPDYSLVIKPRFLHSDKVITHYNNIFLYDVIREECNNDLPDNMIMLDKHMDLKTLINKASTVICLYTTAFVGAIVAGKGLVVLDKIGSDDIYDIRNKTFLRNRENIKQSGALVDYREVNSILPKGIIGNDDYIDYLLDERDNSAKKIVEVCEHLVSKYYCNGVIPKVIDSTYKSYADNIVIDRGVSWEEIISKRYRDYILYKSLILIDFHVKAKLDVRCILDDINAMIGENKLTSKEDFIRMLAETNNIRDNCLIRNKAILMNDQIDSGILLNAYYLQRKWDLIREFENRDIAAFDLFRAFIAIEDFEENAKNIAKDRLISYFDKSLERNYIVEISDMSGNKIKAFGILVDILKEEKNVDLLEFYCQKMREYYKCQFGEIDSNCKPNDNRQRILWQYIMDN